MIRILHLVSDDKFIDKHIERFQDSGYQNDFAYLKNEFAYKGKNKALLKWIKPSSKEFEQLVADAGTYDIIFVYYLDYYKAYFLNKLEKRTITIWHFFGSEIYGNNKYPFKGQLFSQTTKGLFKVSRYQLLKEKAKSMLRYFKYRFRNRLTPAGEINKAIGRLDYFAWYIEEEYDLIRSKVESLPRFLYMPIANRAPDLNVGEKDSTKLIIGNSCAPANNHADILFLLQEVNFRGSVLIPFNYGNNPKYINGIKGLIRTLPMQVELLEGFIPYEEYIRKVGACGAAVFNSYRQMALGNIFILLVNGVKIYLSERNPTYNWLKKEGFHIYQIEKDLRKDVENGNLILEEELAAENKSAYARLTDPALNKRFIDSLGEIVQKKHKLMQ